MAEVTCRHELDCSIAEYWDRCVFDDAFNRALYIERLRFPLFERLPSQDAPGKRAKRAKIEPPIGGVPAPVKKAIGDKLAYVEDGWLDEATGRYEASITPSMFADKTKVRAELWCEPSPSGDPNKCVRHARVKVDVKVMLVGGMVEEKIVSDLKASYDAEADFIREWMKR